MKTKVRWHRVMGYLLILCLAATFVFAALNMVTAPESSSEEGERTKSDYALMLFQCIIALALMLLPNLLKKRFDISVSDGMLLVFYIFLFGSIYLGNIRNFYVTVPHWDTVQHCLSGMMLGAMGFSLVDILNRAENVNVKLGPVFTAVFAFCFAITAGAAWEMLEYAIDGLFGQNMQRFMYFDGTPKIGRDALTDTMKDLIVDAAGALIVCSGGYFSVTGRRENKKKLVSSPGK